MSLCERLALYFKARPNEWLDGHALMHVGGSFAFRTRISELRKPPYGMTIENEVLRHQRKEVVNGEVVTKHWTETRYRYVPPREFTQARLIEEASNEAADSAPTHR